MSITRRSLLLASGAAGLAGALPVRAQQQQATMRVATVSPDAHPSSQILKRVAERINARQDANLKVEVFTAGTLGGDLELIDQVARGAIEASLAGGASVLSSFDRRFGIEELPFMYASRQAAYKALDGKLGAALNAAAEKQGFKIVAYWENGFRHFTNNKRPIRTPADMSGLRFRSAEIPIRLDMFKQLKASAVPMPFPELFQALQQGVVDGQENPIAIVHSMGIATVQKYLSLSGHIYNSLPLVASKKWWDSIDDKTRQLITTEFAKGRDEERAMLAEREAAMLDELKAKGMQVNETDSKAFQSQTEGVWKMYESRFGPELMSLAREARGFA